MESCCLSDIRPEVAIGHEAKEGEGRPEPAPLSASNLDKLQKVLKPSFTELHTRLAQDSEKQKEVT